MNPKSIFQISMIIVLIIILYLLGTRINVNVGKVRKIQEQSISPAPSINTQSISPAPTPEVKEEGIPGPYGVLTNQMINNMDNYPHKNPMMYKKRERVFLDNINE